MRKLLGLWFGTRLPRQVISVEVCSVSEWLLLLRFRYVQVFQVIHISPKQSGISIRATLVMVLSVSKITLQEGLSHSTSLTGRSEIEQMVSNWCNVSPKSCSFLFQRMTIAVFPNGKACTSPCFTMFSFSLEIGITGWSYSCSPFLSTQKLVPSNLRCHIPFAPSQVCHPQCMDIIIKD